MRLKSLTLAGFKSFPERTKLDFGPGVSVVVGPNGSGKSNVTDAVLWALGEQSPLAVRGASMQDVIFAGGRGVQPRSAAEVEVVLDNQDGAVELPLSEISIVRRLDRKGEGGYWLNGARCRLTDVLEMLSDTGLGKETHSVISQGRVDAIVTSKPRDRRMLIEEAAGLGKHRKRRRRAQLKLERTQENVDRVLDVEREARSRLRPLKRQAEAAQLHERLERQVLDARRELTADRVRARREELGLAETPLRRRPRAPRDGRGAAAGDARAAPRGRAGAGRAERPPRAALAPGLRGAHRRRADRAAPRAGGPAGRRAGAACEPRGGRARPRDRARRRGWSAGRHRGGTRQALPPCRPRSGSPSSSRRSPRSRPSTARASRASSPGSSRRSTVSASGWQQLDQQGALLREALEQRRAAACAGP